MQINDDWRLTSDHFNVILSRRTKDKDGEITDRFDTVAYCCSPHDALEYLTKLEVLGTGMEDLRKVTRKIDALHKTIRKIKEVKR